VASLGGDAFECPPKTKARVELQGAVVCSPREDTTSPDTLPAQTCRPIDRRCGEDAAETDPDKNMQPEPEADIEANRRFVARSCDALCERNARCYDNDSQRVAGTCGVRRTACKADSERLLSLIKTRYFEVTTTCLENTCTSSEDVPRKVWLRSAWWPQVSRQRKRVLREVKCAHFQTTDVRCTICDLSTHVTDVHMP